MNQSLIYDAIIVGAGISGVMCAKKLHDSNLNVLVLDKGRNFGGRMSTKKYNGAIFDHGAQFFTSKTDVFRDYCNFWYENDVIDIWYDYDLSGESKKNHPRWFCRNGMNSLAKFIAKDIEVLRSTNINKIQKYNSHWILKSMHGHNFKSEKLILTIPVPQIINLINNSEVILESSIIRKFESIEYEKGLAILAILNNKSGIIHPGIIQPKDNRIAWISDNQIKGLSEIPSLTIHTNPEYASKMFYECAEKQALPILSDLNFYIKSKCIDYHVHKWGYTTPINYLNPKHFHNKELELYFAGDSFSGPRVESSALSGLNTANEILNI